MKPLYLFHGEDSYTSVQKALHWQKEFQKKYGDINVEIFEGETLTAAQLAEAVSTLPFLSDKKLVVIRDFFANAPAEELKKAAEHLDRVDENCIIVFVERQKADARTALYKTIKKLGEAKEFPLMEKEELVQWITAEVRKQNEPAPPETPDHIQDKGKDSAEIGPKIMLDSRTIHHLAESVGPNLWQMKQELEKIGLYAAGTSLTSDEIEAIISPNLSTTIFKLTDYLALKKRKDSLKTLHILLETGENIIPVMFMIVRHFRILIQIQDCLKQGLSAGAIAKKIRQHPYTVQKGLSQARNFTPETLARIYKSLLEIDIATKSGKIRTTTGDVSQLRLALETFIVKLCT